MPVAFALLLFVILASAATLARRPGEGLGLPVVALMSFAFLYVVQPLFLLYQGQLDLFLTDRQVARAMLLPAVTLATFILGWLTSRPPRRTVARPWAPQRLWSFGLFTAALGLVLYGIFVLRSGGFAGMYSLQHGGALAWTDNTAYLYMGPWWTIAGIAMMFLAASQIRREPWRWAIPGCLTLVMCVNAVLLASRGFLFATAAAALASIALGRQWNVTLWRVAPVALAAGLCVLAMLAFRSVLYSGGVGAPLPDVAEALNSTMGHDASSLARRVTGNEFIVHAAVLDTVDATGKHHRGLNWLYVYLVHPIPRVLWPGKPYRFETSGIDDADVYANTGIVIAGGAAPGIVADLYANFGWFSIPFFWLFGTLARRLHVRAVALASPLACVAYVMLLAAGLNCFAQGFGAILVPYPYSLGPVLLYALSQSALSSPARLWPCRP